MCSSSCWLQRQVSYPVVIERATAYQGRFGKNTVERLAMIKLSSAPVSRRVRKPCRSGMARARTQQLGGNVKMARGFDLKLLVLMGCAACSSGGEDMTLENGAT